jgi:hypothetical protein
MFRVPPDTDNVPLMTESSVSVSAAADDGNVFVREQTVDHERPAGAVRTVIVRSPA